MVKKYFENFLILLNDFLSRDYRGRTARDWLLLIFGYSLIVWFVVLGFLAYDFYQNYRNLKSLEGKKLNILHDKENQISRIKMQIKEIEKAYKILKVYFAPFQVAPLRNKLQRDFLKQQENIKKWYLFASEKYIFPEKEKVTVKEDVVLYKFQLKDFQLLDKVMLQFSEFYNSLKSLDKEIKGGINLTKLGNYYVLYFDPKGGNRVTLKTYKYYGYIKDIFKSKIPIEGSYFNSRQIKSSDYSKLFLVGWILELAEGGF